MSYLSVYQISAKGTEYEGQEVICFKIASKGYYCPSLKQAFFRIGKGLFSNKKVLFPEFDAEWEFLQKNPHWRNRIEVVNY